MRWLGKESTAGHASAQSLLRHDQTAPIDVEVEHNPSFDVDYSPTPERNGLTDRSNVAVVRLGRGKGGKESAGHYESIDFDPWDSFVSRLHDQAQLMRVSGVHQCCSPCRSREKHKAHDDDLCGYFKQRAAKRWCLNFLIAVCTALVAVGITFVTRSLFWMKFSIVGNLVQQEQSNQVSAGVACMAFVGISTALAVLSSLLVAYVEPVAAGSGISEIKCILNGIKLPRAVRFKTLLVKALGVTLSVASGLPVGKEGPMIHSGAVVAAGLSQGKSRTLGISTSWTTIPDFRNDFEKRDFISCGAAAGVAAAFNAPVGGTLFALEEGASFWSQALTWRAFVCAMVSAYTINLGISAMDGHWGDLSTLGMFSFGDFTSTGQNQRSYVAIELVAFTGMGCLGGAIGALFNSCNRRLTQFRMQHITAPWQRVLEAALIAAVMAGLAYLLPLSMGSCQVVPKASNYANSVVQFYCADGEYNDMATFFFAPSEDAIRMLFHFETEDALQPAFNPAGLCVGFVIYAAMTCITYGIAVPSGLFVPSLLTGSALGRALGELINVMAGSRAVDPGTYSLIGAAAMLGGMARMTISLAVILLECTGDLQYGLPLMITLLAARWTGNSFNEGLYDIHIHLKHWPLLEEKPRKGVAVQLRVCDVMVKPVKHMCEVMRVREVLELLAACSHNGFPVLYSAETLHKYPRFGTLAGFVNRKHLTTLIVAKAFHRHKPLAMAADEDGQGEEGRRSPTGDSDGTGTRLFDGDGPTSPAAGSGAISPEPPHVADWRSTDPAATGPGASPTPLRPNAAGRAPLQHVPAPGGAASSGRSGPGSALDGATRRGRRSAAASGGPGTATRADAAAIRTLATAQWEHIRQGAYVPRVGRAGSFAERESGAEYGSRGTPLLPRMTKASNRSASAVFFTSQALQPAPAAADGQPRPAGYGSRGERYLAPPSVAAALLAGGTHRIPGGSDSLLPGDGSDSSINAGRAAAAAAARLPAPVHAEPPDAGVTAAVSGTSVPVMESAALYGLDFEGKPLLGWSDFEMRYPRYPTAWEARRSVSETELDQWLDIRPYMNTTPFTVHARAPLMRAYRLYRSMGLRHLVVVNDAFDAVGILTRADLLPENLHDCLRRRLHREEQS